MGRLQRKKGHNSYKQHLTQPILPLHLKCENVALTIDPQLPEELLQRARQRLVLHTGQQTK